MSTASLGSWLGGRWEKVGAAAAFASLLAAALDVVENTALLHVLEDNAGARLAQIAAAAKFLLALAALAVLLASLVAAVAKGERARPDDEMPKAAPDAGPRKALTCDVVMKGGITSGIVYPRAVARLADEYRFVNVGGASAGAIAASLTAAAEYARAKGRDGFAVLAALPTWLGTDGRLFKLFRPNAETRGPFDVFVAFLGDVTLPFKLARALVVAAFSFPVCCALGLVPGGLLAWAAFATSTPAWGVTGAVAISLLVVPLALVAGLLAAVVVALPRNGFGMCSGHIDGQVSLSDWLARLLEAMCGVQGRPLVFADLWTAGETFASVDDLRAAAAGRAAADRTINFEALTTSLVHGRPYRMPEPGRTFYFRRQDLEHVLPRHVVDWMVAHPGEAKEREGRTLPPEFLPLPAPHDLPVVFAVRLSLSFPFLLSAVKLWGVDWSKPVNRRPGQPLALDESWMSDGGIASNFPIHFFDALVPSRPTFGLDLASFQEARQPDADESKNVFLPDNNAEGSQESWNHFRGIGGFIGALVDAIQAFMDNMQAHAPGFRDRIARIYLADEEGGLNLTMPGDVVERLAKRGAAAGDKIVKRFVHDRPSGWENHRWVRMRSLLGLLDPQLRHLADVLVAHPVPEPASSYPWHSATRAKLATDVVDDLIHIGQRLEASGSNLTEGEPRPVPVLRTTPRV
jgi:predicted acylesterase/phospholipase RssA